MSNTALIGGKSAGNGAVKNNALEISSSAAGSTIKSAEKFDNYKFVLGADATDGTTILSSKEKLNLAGASVNTELSETTLKKGEKVVLLDNADKSNAVFQINGTTGDKLTAAKNNLSYVDIKRYGYDTGDNKIAIKCEDNCAAGGFLNKDGKLTGDVTLVIGGNNRNADLSKYEDVYGAYSDGNCEPSVSIVQIVSAVDLSNTRLHGGYSTANGLCAKFALLLCIVIQASKTLF